MSEQTQQGGSSQQTVVEKLGYVSRTKPRAQEQDYYGNKGVVLPYETYQKTIGPQLTLNQDLKDNKDYLKDRATTHYKAWKEEDKPADGYRHFIKHSLSLFLKERGYTIAQVYSVIGGRIWKEQRDNQMMRLIQIGYAAFWNSQLGEIPDDTNDDGDEIFTIPTEQAIKEAKQKRDEKRAREQRSYESDMAKIKARKKPTFRDGKTVESARILPYDFQDDLDDYLIEDE
ncbi:MAG: hypothetical protein EZS28_034760 [Streblomastix strix]|uniref:Uncharacterized protein n=1 Tax=Streblomastix strix TaxID=222440 RepID=A0A5J4UHS5_9EUKA|nr:MAG: hypothetical protein EZS28_034760 [Streblomastix strix]